MRKILIFNFLFLLIFALFGCYFLHEYFVSEYTEKAIYNLSLQKNNPYYNKVTAVIGTLPQKNETSTNYLKIKPKANKIRVGFFGDSNTMGSEVLPGHEFPAVLQKRLGETYQVINFGQSGYNSNQIYLMIKHFSKIFNLDIIVVGPRGFYIERASTFNNYWNQGNIPYVRFIIENNKLKMIEVPGEDTKEKIFNYYSFLPGQTLLRHDHVAPSFLKLTDILFSKEILNPFYPNSRDSSLRAIQVAQLENIAKTFNKPLIHYVDSSSDCEAFKGIKEKNYSLYCVKSFSHIFPYQSKISHPSSFGHYRHAHNIFKILSNQSLDKGSHLFIDNENYIYKTRIKRAKGRAMNLKNFGTYLNGILVAKLKPARGLEDRTGRLKKFTLLREDCEEENCLLLGFYINGQSRANSLFIRVPKSTNIMSRLSNVRFEAIKGFKNVFFYKFSAGAIDHPKNRIYFPEIGVLSLPMTTLFLRSNNKKGNYYKPKFNSYKMVINKKISAYNFLSNLREGNIDVILGEVK